MARWHISKLEFLFWWGFPTAILALPIAFVAWLLNLLTGGAIQAILTAAAIIIITVIATIRAMWVFFWTEIG